MLQSTLMEPSEAPSRARRLATTAGLLTLLVVAFASVGRWGVDANPDAAAAAIPAWNLVLHGDLDLTEYEGPLPWAVDVGGNVYSNRPPGLIALALPAYLLVRPAVFTNGPATAVALLVSLLAVFVVWRTIRPLTTVAFATGAAVVYALGMSTWVISSAQLWPHGPGQLLLGLAVLNLSQGRHILSGVAFGVEILVRPLTAIAAALTGVLESLRTRSIRPTARIGAPSLIGLGLLMAYNRFLFGEWSVSGGYSAAFTTGAVERFDPLSYLHSLAQMFLLPPNGLLLWTPIIGIAIFGVWKFRDLIAGWARSAAWSGLAYLLVHAALNRASGGLDLMYRYPLEAIALALPALAVGAYRLLEEAGPVARILVLAATASIALQFVGATIVTCTRFSAAAPICSLIG